MTAARSTDGTRERQSGDRIGQKLELVRRLGEGGMGTLWVARNLTTHAEVAIKVLRSHRENDDHAAERFRHEARLGAMLAHRNITRVFDLLEDDDGILVLVMELLHGQTLEASYKEKGALSTREAVEIMVPILGALQHAHENGVVHRDVKPSNIVLDVDPDGHVTPKLLDFGIAKTHDASVLTRTGDALGSPSYMSPEQVRASKQLDARSDVFSAAVVLYEIISGENPFNAPSPTAALARVLELEVDPDPRIEPLVWLEIRRALSKQPYQRHSSASSLADALSRATGGTTSSQWNVRFASQSPAPAASDDGDRESPPPLASMVEREASAVADTRPETSIRSARRHVALAAAAVVLAVAVALFLRFGGSGPARRAASEATAGATVSAPISTASAPAVEPGEAPVAAQLSAPSASVLPASARPRVRPSVATHATSDPAPDGARPAPRASASTPSVARTPGF